MKASVQRSNQAYLGTQAPETHKYQRPRYNKAKPSFVLTLVSIVTIALAGLCSTLIASNSLAETIALPHKDSSRSAPRPTRGTTKAEVQARFGDPLSKDGPRGNPSIYFWEYPDYTVYFEDDIVIHAVSKEKSLKPL